MANVDPEVLDVRLEQGLERGASTADVEQRGVAARHHGVDQPSRLLQSKMRDFEVLLFVASRIPGMLVGLLGCVMSRLFRPFTGSRGLEAQPGRMSLEGCAPIERGGGDVVSAHSFSSCPIAPAKGCSSLRFVT